MKIDYCGLVLKKGFLLYYVRNEGNIGIIYKKVFLVFRSIIDIVKFKFF